VYLIYINHDIELCIQQLVKLFQQVQLLITMQGTQRNDNGDFKNDKTMSKLFYK